MYTTCSSFLFSRLLYFIARYFLRRQIVKIFPCKVYRKIIIIIKTIKDNSSCTYDRYGIHTLICVLMSIQYRREPGKQRDKLDKNALFLSLFAMIKQIHGRKFQNVSLKVLEYFVWTLATHSIKSWLAIARLNRSVRRVT